MESAWLASYGTLSKLLNFPGPFYLGIKKLFKVVVRNKWVSAYNSARNIIVIREIYPIIIFILYF